jgi:hypothetical protein
MARGGLDYAFFQLLSERIQRASSDEQAKLTELREDLLEMTNEIDEAIKEQQELAGQLLDKILEREDIEEATMDALPSINEIFLDVLRSRINKARKEEDQGQLTKLQKVAGVIQKISAPGANIELIEQLIQAEDEQDVNAILDENEEELTDDFMQFLMNLLNQTQGQESQRATAEKLQQIYRQALRFTMKRNLEKQAE